MSDKLSRTATYGIVDWQQLATLDIKVENYNTGAIQGGRKSGEYKAQWDGNPRRPPKKGEFYLSGSTICAYFAPNDLTTPFHIARIVEVETVTTVNEIVKPIKGK